MMRERKGIRKIGGRGRFRFPFEIQCDIHGRVFSFDQRGVNGLPVRIKKSYVQVIGRQRGCHKSATVVGETVYRPFLRLARMGGRSRHEIMDIAVWLQVLQVMIVSTQVDRHVVFL